MSFSYENQGTNTYLVYEIADEVIDSMSLGMITNNRIPGFVPTIYTQMNNAKYLKYNISSRVSAKQFLQGIVNKKRLTGVFLGVVNALIVAEEYMIDINSINLDLEYIYVDVSTCNAEVICVPVETKNNGNNIATFFRNIVFSTQFDQTENCDYVAKLINYLNGNPVFSLSEFKLVLDDINGVKEQVVTEQSTVDNVSVAQMSANMNGQMQQSQANTIQNFQQPVSKQVQPINVASVQSTMPVQPVMQKQLDKKDNKERKVNKVIQQPTIPGEVPGIEIPGGSSMPIANNSKSSGKVKDAQFVNGEKKMTMMRLLRNYSKENAAIYKAQKEAKKAAKQNKAAQPAMPVQQPAQQAMPQQPVMPAQQPTQQAMSQQPAQQAMPQQPVMPTQQPTQQAMSQQPVQQAMPQQPAMPAQQPVQQGRPAMPAQQAMPDFAAMVPPTANYGETTVLNAGAVAVSQPRLIRKKNNETININKPVFRIGKEKSYVDYFISDNSAISRSHANVICKGEEYFVMDTNSTNHTYVNGVMIQSNQEIKIESGNKIRLANEEFEFLI